MHGHQGCYQGLNKTTTNNWLKGFDVYITVIIASANCPSREKNRKLGLHLTEIMTHARVPNSQQVIEALRFDRWQE